MSEIRPFIEPGVDRAEKYKYVKDPNYFTNEDAYRARFVAVEQATKNNPEQRGTASIILAACYMAFGPERVDLNRLGNDVLLPRLNGYFIAYNDQVDIAEKIKDSDPDVYQLIMDHVQKYKQKFDEYFLPTGDTAEDERRHTFKQFYNKAFTEIDHIEHELFTVQQPHDSNDHATADAELERINHGRELVNALETLINIRACAGPTMFADRNIDTVGSLDIASLTQKYAWLIDEAYDDNDLTEDEAKARALFFAVMSNQMILDSSDYKEDRCFGIWKKMTYLTEMLHVPEREAKRIVRNDADHYAELVNHYGISVTPLLAANAAGFMLSKAKNNLRDYIANYALKKGHIRELAVSTLQKKHPERYTM